MISKNSQLRTVGHRATLFQAVNNVQHFCFHETVIPSSRIKLLALVGDRSVILHDDCAHLRGRGSSIQFELLLWNGKCDEKFACQ